MKREIKSLHFGLPRVLDRLAAVLEVFDELLDQIDAVGLVIDDIKQTLGDLAEERPDLKWGWTRQRSLLVAGGCS